MATTKYAPLLQREEPSLTIHSLIAGASAVDLNKPDAKVKLLAAETLQPHWQYNF